MVGTIYVLICPVTHSIRYVGKTSKDIKRRLYEHMLCYDKHTHKSQWIKKLKSNGLTPIIKQVGVYSESILNNMERFWINYFKNTGSKLTNGTNGGDGIYRGYKHTQTAKDNMRKSAKPTNKRPICQYDMKGNFIREWESAYQVEGYNRRAIVNNLTQKSKSSAGFIWKYKEN